MSAGAGFAGAIMPGYLCTIVAIGSGFAMDIYICQPADELYCRKVTRKKVNCGISMYDAFESEAARHFAFSEAERIRQ